MANIRRRFILGSFRPLAIDTEKASIARPTPSSILLTKKRKLHSIIGSSMDSFLGAKKTGAAPAAVPGGPSGEGRQTPCTQHASGAGDMSLAGEGARGSLRAHRPPCQGRRAGEYVDLPR